MRDPVVCGLSVVEFFLNDDETGNQSQLSTSGGLVQGCERSKEQLENKVVAVDDTDSGSQNNIPESLCMIFLHIGPRIRLLAMINV